MREKIEFNKQKNKQIRSCEDFSNVIKRRRVSSLAKLEKTLRNLFVALSNLS